MEREHWAVLSQMISEVGSRWPTHMRDSYSTAAIVRVFAWAVIHNCPVSWACRPGNWDDRTRPKRLPSQSQMSRRTRRDDFEPFLTRLGQRIAGQPGSMQLLKTIDGKALTIPAHSTDRDAKWGRGTGQRARGYKLHALWADRPMPEQWAVTPLDQGEPRLAKRFVGRLNGAGYVLADANYDSNALYDLAAEHQHQLLAPRGKPYTGLGHRRHSPHRRRAIELLEQPAFTINRFGTDLYRQRTDIERHFAHATCFAGGLLTLPPWVRRIWRVRAWVAMKLLINAARVRCMKKRREAVDA